MKFISNEIRIIVAGSRSFENTCNPNLITRLIDGVIELLVDGKNTIFDPPIRIISGHAKGIDQLGEQVAKKNNYRLTVMPADWDKYGKRAGYIRNEEMIEFAKRGKEAHLVVVHDGISKGTAHMMKRCEKEGIQVSQIPYIVTARQFSRTGIVTKIIQDAIIEENYGRGSNIGVIARSEE